jgi:hypothetical protein
MLRQPPAALARCILFSNAPPRRSRRLRRRVRFGPKEFTMHDETKPVLPLVLVEELVRDSLPPKEIAPPSLADILSALQRLGEAARMELVERQRVRVKFQQD